MSEIEFSFFSTYLVEEYSKFYSRFFAVYILMTKYNELSTLQY